MNQVLFKWTAGPRLGMPGFKGQHVLYFNPLRSLEGRKNIRIINNFYSIRWVFWRY
jgi:hypothetical protein